MSIIGFCCPIPDPANVSAFIGALGGVLFAICRSRACAGRVQPGFKGRRQQSVDM